MSYPAVQCNAPSSLPDGVRRFLPGQHCCLHASTVVPPGNHSCSLPSVDWVIASCTVVDGVSTTVSGVLYASSHTMSGPYYLKYIWVLGQESSVSATSLQLVPQGTCCLHKPGDQTKRNF